jgi:hypothetical protein
VLWIYICSTGVTKKKLMMRKAHAKRSWLHERGIGLACRSDCSESG